MFAAILWLYAATLFSCANDKAQEEEEVASSKVALYPPSGGQGISMEVDLDASASVFSYSGTVVDFGDGITVSDVNVDDGWGARASIVIDPDADLGLRDVYLTTGGRSFDMLQSFEVVSDSFIIEPDNAKMGEIVEVGILGNNTEWESGRTWPNFGDGIEVLEFSVLTGTLAEALISISPDSAPGWRNVTVDSGGGDYIVLYDGFKVDRVGLGASFDPSLAEQGETVEFTVRARGTDFVSEVPLIQFHDRFGENPDIVINDVTVLDAENLYGRMTLSNAAALGMRDVLIESSYDSVRIPDAFEVIGGGWDLSEVAISIAFNVTRFLDPDSCQLYEQVTASALFFIPLNPPCGGGGMGMPPAGPQPYDNNGVFEDPEGSGGEGEDCPFPTTLPAGDFVWFESNANIVTMDKTYDSATGTVYYWGNDLTMADYVAGQTYDLHTQGEEGGIGEYLLEAIQPTVPSDWQWISPDLCGLVHNRNDDFPFEWTPAMTYPDAIFSVSVSGTLVANGKGGYAGVLPWDDGAHGFTPNELIQLESGGVGFSAYSYIKGPTFGFPESIYQENESESYISLSSSFTLE
jgi:hypothetical protein